MREYQVKRLRNYLLPETVYRQALWAIKDLNRLRAELNSTVEDIDSLHSPSFFNESKGKGLYSDITASKAEKLGSGARGLKTVIDNIFMYASAEINMEEPNDRDLIVCDETIENPKVYELKKVKRGNEYELSKRTGEDN